MPSYSWTLTGPLAAETPAVGALVPGTQIAPPLTSYVQQDFLDLFDRLFPEFWLQPLKDPGPGYELFQAYAKAAQRASEAVCTFGADAFIGSAQGGAKATGLVWFFRSLPHPEGISVTIKAGTVVTCSRGGQDFKTLDDVTFGPTDLGPLEVAVEAVAEGYEWNVPGKVVLGGT